MELQAGVRCLVLLASDAAIPHRSLQSLEVNYCRALMITSIGLGVLYEGYSNRKLKNEK